MRDPLPTRPALSFAGSAQRIWRLTGRSDNPWHIWALTMTAMALTPAAWVLVALQHVAAAPVRVLRRMLGRLGAHVVAVVIR